MKTATLLIFALLVPACDGSNPAAATRNPAPSNATTSKVAPKAPKIAARNLPAAKETADRALAACDRLYQEPNGCFWYAGDDVVVRENAPVVLIGDLWSGDKSDIDFLQAQCEWTDEGIERAFPASVEKVMANKIGKLNCRFRPYPRLPELLNPGSDPACSTRKPADGWSFLDGRDGELVEVPFDPECAGKWESIEVTRTSRDGTTRVDVTVWLKTPNASAPRQVER